MLPEIAAMRSASLTGRNSTGTPPSNSPIRDTKRPYISCSTHTTFLNAGLRSAKSIMAAALAKGPDTPRISSSLLGGSDASALRSFVFAMSGAPAT